MKEWEKRAIDMFVVYLVPFCGKILEATVTDDASITEYWFMKNVELSQEIRHNIIGLQCIWEPHPMNNVSWKGHKISTILFCVDTKCLLLQLSHMNSNALQSVKSFLSDSNNTFVGVEVEVVVSTLENEYGVCCNETVFDVRALAKRRFPFSFGGRTGLKTLAYQLVKLPVWKPKKGGFLRDFETSKKLDKDQVKSACIDVYASYRIGHKLLMEI